MVAVVTIHWISSRSTCGESSDDPHPQFVIGRELRRGLTVDEANTAMPLNSVDRMDREALSLRHFEEMSRAETARSFRWKRPPPRNAYIRLLKRLNKYQASMPGGFDSV